MKLGKLGTLLALALGLGMILSLAPFTSDAFAQSTNNSNTRVAAQAAIATSILQETSQASQQQLASSMLQEKQNYGCYRYYRYGRFFTKCSGYYPRYVPRYNRGYVPRYNRGYVPRYNRGYVPRYNRGYVPRYNRGYVPGYNRGYYPQYTRGSRR